MSTLAEQVREAKRAAKEKIRTAAAEAVGEFMRQTSMQVEDVRMQVEDVRIHMVDTSTYSARSCAVGSVKIEVSL